MVVLGSWEALMKLLLLSAIASWGVAKHKRSAREAQESPRVTEAF